MLHLLGPCSKQYGRYSHLSLSSVVLAGSQGMIALKNTATNNLGSSPSRPTQSIRLACQKPGQASVSELLLNAGAVLNVRVEQTQRTGLGLTWGDEQQIMSQIKDAGHIKELLVASIPVSHILFVGNPATDGSHLPLPKQLQSLLNPALNTSNPADSPQDNPHSESIVGVCDIEWDLRLAGLLVWALSQGQNYLNGFWCQYAQHLLPSIEQPVSLLVFNACELRYLQDASLKHSALAWQREVQNIYERYIAPWQPCQPPPIPHNGDNSYAESLPQLESSSKACNTAGSNEDDNSIYAGNQLITAQLYRWAVAMVASRAYGVKTHGQRYHVFVPIWGEANHDPAADTVSRWLTTEELAVDELQGDHVALYVRLQQAKLSHTGAESITPDPELPIEGSPCYTNYGDKSNRQLMEQYGFVLAGSPSDGSDLTVSLQQFPPLIQTTTRTRLVWHHQWTGNQEQYGNRHESGGRLSRRCVPLSQNSGQVKGLKLLKRDRITRALQTIISSQTSQGMHTGSEEAATGNSSSLGACSHCELLLQGLLGDAQRHVSGHYQNAQAAIITLQDMLAPFFSSDARIRRLRAAAAKLSDVYGCRDLAQFRTLTIQSELAAADQALQCIKAKILLSAHPSARHHDDSEHLPHAPDNVSSTTDAPANYASEASHLCADTDSKSGCMFTCDHSTLVYRGLLKQVTALLMLELGTTEQGVTEQQRHVRPAAVRAASLYCIERHLVDLAAFELLLAIRTDIGS